MAVISFGEGPERKWFVARWCHNRFLRDVVAWCRDDEAVVDAIQRAIAFDGLILRSLYPNDQALADRILRAIKEVASATLAGEDFSGAAWKTELKEEHHETYLNRIRELLELVNVELRETR